jgi:hypothetical protein
MRNGLPGRQWSSLMTFVNRCVYWSSTYLRVYDLCTLRVRRCVRLKLFIVVRSVDMRRNAVLEDRDCGSQARWPSGLYNSFVSNRKVSNSPTVRHDPHNTSRPSQLHKLHLQSVQFSLKTTIPTPTHLFMPAQEHTHSLSTTLSATKASSTNLRETRLLRRGRLATCRCVCRFRLTLAHALVEVLRAAFGLVNALQDGRHFRLPY